MPQPVKSGARSSARAAAPASTRQLIVETATAPSAENSLVTAHCTVVAVDIEEFGRYNRTNLNQVRIRRGMYGAMEDAFDKADISWSSCYHEDRGDGILILAQADVPKALFVDRLPDALVSALNRHNTTHPPAEQMRLRLALHAGEINYDEHGVTGSAINHTFRLLNSYALAQSLAASPATLAVIGSAWFFDEVIRHSEGSHSKAYRRTQIVNKETTAQGWIRLLRNRGSNHGSVRRRQINGNRLVGP